MSMKVITLKIEPELLRILDEVARDYYHGNRSLLIREAIKYFLKNQGFLKRPKYKRILSVSSLKH